MAIKMRCVSRCQFKGDIVRVGDIVEMDEETLKKEPLAKSAFVNADPSAEESAGGQPKIIVAGLTREQTVLKLKSMKVVVPPDATDDDLAKIFAAAVDSKENSRTR